MDESKELIDNPDEAVKFTTFSDQTPVMYDLIKKILAPLLPGVDVT